MQNVAFKRFFIFIEKAQGLDIWLKNYNSVAGNGR